MMFVKIVVQNYYDVNYPSYNIVRASDFELTILKFTMQITDNL